MLIAAERKAFDMPAFLRSHGDAPVALASITAVELLHGCERAADAHVRHRRTQFVEGLLSTIPSLSFGLPEARVHARIWASLTASGFLVGPHDLLVAATAVSLSFAVATLNRTEFGRVAGLPLVATDEFSRSSPQAPAEEP